MVDLISPILWRFDGDKQAGKQYMHRGAELMRDLEGRMAESRFAQFYQQDTLHVRPAPGVLIVAKKCFGSRIVTITVEKLGDRRKKKIPVKLVKIFVHVDMINSTPGVFPPSEHWEQYYYEDSHGDVFRWDDPWNLERNHVTSAVACGIISVYDGRLFWSDVKVPVRVPSMEGEDTSTEYLACNGTNGSPWEGIYLGIGTNTPETLFQWYNDLFPLAPYRDETMPTITDDDTWIKQETRAFEAIPGIEPLYSPDDNYDYWDSPHPDKMFSMKASTYDADWDYTIIQRKTTVLFYDYYHYWDDYNLNRFGIDEEGEEDWHNLRFITGYFLTKDGTPSADPVDVGVPWYRYHPLLGVVWSHNQWFSYPAEIVGETPAMECQQFNGIEWIDWPEEIWHMEGWFMRPLRMDQGVIDEDTTYPVVPRNMYPWRFYTDELGWDDHDFFQYSGTDATQNYKAPDGFCWYSGISGGLLFHDIKETYPDCTPVFQIDEISFRDSTLRTLISIGAAAGKNIFPWKDRTMSPIVSAIRGLAVEAITFLGGSVYSNRDIPDELDIKDYLRADFLGHSGVTISYDWRSASGLLYCSPCYGIRIYGVPVTSTLEIEI